VSQGSGNDRVSTGPPRGEPALSPPPPPEAPVPSLEDPVAYHAFVRSLFARIEPRLAAELDTDLQVEIAQLSRLLNAMPRRVVDDHRQLFELAFGLIAAERPNLVLLRSLVGDLFTIYQRSVGGVARLFLLVSGRTPINAVLSGLLTIIAMSFGLMLLMGGSLEILHGTGAVIGVETGSSAVLRGAAFGQLLLMMHAAFLGSFVSLVVRMSSYLTASALTPLLIYLSVVTRPLASVLFAVLVFSTLKSRLVAIYGLDLDGPNGAYLAWALGFLCGFSERLAQDFALGASRTLGEPAGSAARPGHPGSVAG
jgi:hypothetical protein